MDIEPLKKSQIFKINICEFRPTQQIEIENHIDHKRWKIFNITGRYGKRSSTSCGKKYELFDIEASSSRSVCRKQNFVLSTSCLLAFIPECARRASGARRPKAQGRCSARIHGITTVSAPAQRWCWMTTLEKQSTSSFGFVDLRAVQHAAMA